MDGSKSIGDLADVSPEDILRDCSRATVTVSLEGRKVVLGKGLRQRMIIVAKDKGAVTELPAGEGLMERDNV